LEEYSLEQITKEFESLLDMEIESAEDFTSFLQKQKKLYEKVDEKLLRHYITFQCFSDDEENKQKYEYDQQHIKPLYKKFQSQVDQKVISSPYFKVLSDEEFGEYKKKLQIQASLFQESNLDIEKEEDQFSNRYFEITGGLTSMWEGQEVTISELYAHARDSNREIRKKAFEAIYTPIIEKEDEIQKILDKLIDLRVKKAGNAEFTSFTDYMFKKYNRNDYTPEDCKQFAESVRKHVVPLVKKIEEEHKQELKVDAYLPWDMHGERAGKKPLKPVETSEELISKSAKVLGNLHQEFGELVHKMDKKNLLDLTSRKGKTQGGFCESLPETGLSFIFMNMSKTHDDLLTFMHEMGHGIHDALKSDQELYAYKQIPMESAELASMSMEFFSLNGWNEFYKEEDLNRAKKELLKSAVGLLPYIMVVDQFQHWLYQNPKHSWQERNKKFGELQDYYAASLIKWDGYEDWKEKNWMYILHIFELPFYYIEYAIAQIGALQMYKLFKENPDQTITNYRAALSLGSSKSLPEIYTAAGIKFDFSEKTIAELMEFVRKELDLLAVEI
jgi:oligoendopeptidase F